MASAVNYPAYPKVCANPIMVFWNFFPIANAVYFTVTIKKPPLLIETSPITDMGVAHAFEHNLPLLFRTELMFLSNLLVSGNKSPLS